MNALLTFALPARRSATTDDARGLALLGLAFLTTLAALAVLGCWFPTF